MTRGWALYISRSYGFGVMILWPRICASLALVFNLFIYQARESSLVPLWVSDSSSFAETVIDEVVVLIEGEKGRASLHFFPGGK